MAWLGTEKVRGDLRILVEGSTVSPRNVSIRIRSRDGEIAQRQFAPGPERCDHLHAVVGLAIALSIRASLLGEIGAKTPSTEREHAWGLALEPLVARGVVSGWGVGAEVRVERALLRGLTLRAGVFGMYGSEGSFPQMAGHFDVWLAAARLDACGVLEISSGIEGRACQGLAGGGLLAEGHAFPRSDSSLVRWLAVANSVDLVFRLSDDWAVNLGLELLVPLERTSIVVRNGTGAVVDQVELAAAGALARFGPIYRF
jgi:hypothetical protein